mgnify:CR=1 FL=1|jgi:hypothetical protein
MFREAGELLEKATAPAVLLTLKVLEKALSHYRVAPMPPDDPRVRLIEKLTIELRRIAEVSRLLDPKFRAQIERHFLKLEAVKVFKDYDPIHASPQFMRSNELYLNILCLTIGSVSETRWR